MTITELAVPGMLGYVGRPISGYDLHKLIGISVGFIWQPSKTQLYAVLPRLLDAGLARRREVEQRQRPDKNLYRMTSRGRLAIREWVNREEDMRDEDRGRSVLLLKVFFGRQGDREALVRQVAAFRDASALKLATYQRMWEEGKTPPRDDLYARLTLRHGIVRTRSAVEWADAALQELTQWEATCDRLSAACAFPIAQHGSAPPRAGRSGRDPPILARLQGRPMPA